MITPTPLILDCDPGIDDFIAILMILAAPERFNLLGITVSGGNVPVEYTTLNALKACELADRRDVKVYSGCPNPVLRPLIKEEGVHGVTGLEGDGLPPPTMLPQSTHAVDFLIETLMASPVPITLATTGPLTNVALAIVQEPRILDNVDKIVTMGGSMTLGKMTPAAEYNFYADPEAAHILFTCGKPIINVGIDVTHQVITSSQWVEQLEALNTPVAQAVGSMLRFYHHYDNEKFELGGGALHDPCVIGYLLNPSLFVGKPVHVEIDTSFGHGRGRSIIDWWNTRNLAPNAHVFGEVNSVGFYDLLMDLLSRYPAMRQVA